MYHSMLVACIIVYVMHIMGCAEVYSAVCTVPYPFGMNHSMLIASSAASTMTSPMAHSMACAHYCIYRSVHRGILDVLTSY